MFLLCHHPHVHQAPSNYAINFIDTVSLITSTWTVRLWNAPPMIDLSLTLASIERLIYQHLWEHFFVVCSFHFVCPCSHCHALRLFHSFKNHITSSITSGCHALNLSFNNGPPSFIDCPNTV